MGRCCRRRKLFVLWQREMERSRSNLLDDSAVLFIETHFQGLFMAGVERQQVEIIVRSAVQYAPAKINGGIDERIGDAAIFRLHVIRRLASCHVPIMTEKHSPIRPGLRAEL